MSEELKLPLAVGTGVEASYNDGSTFTYTPTSYAVNGSATVIPGYNDYYYYNWPAAVAEKGNSYPIGDINGSICPKGWRLPYNYTISNTVSWGALTDVYGITVNGEGLTTTTGYTVLESLPISLKRSGYYNNGGFYGYNETGYYWSSTVPATWFAYNLGYSTSGVSPQNQFTGENIGFFVRCVASPLAH